MERGAVTQPSVAQTKFHTMPPLWQRPERSPRPRRPLAAYGPPPCCAPTGLSSRSPELGHVLLPSDHAASMRSSARRSVAVHVAPRGDAQHKVVPAADARSSIAASETFGYRRAPRTATDSGRTALRRTALHKAQVRQTRRRHVRRRTAPFAHVCASKTRGAAWGSGVFHDAGSHAALQTRGCALSLSVFLLWQWPHSAAARVFCLSAVPGTSRFAFSSFNQISAAHHLRSTLCSSGSEQDRLHAASKRLHSWMGGRVCLASPR